MLALRHQNVGHFGGLSNRCSGSTSSLLPRAVPFLMNHASRKLRLLSLIVASDDRRYRVVITLTGDIIERKKTPADKYCFGFDASSSGCVRAVREMGNCPKIF